MKVGFAHLLSADKRKSNPYGGWDKVRDHFRAEKDHALKCYTPSFTDRAVVNREMEVNVEDINKITPFKRLQIFGLPGSSGSAYYQDDALRQYFTYGRRITG